jgi:hypothetical protein
MSESPPPDDPLVAHLAGKRRAERSPTALAVDILGRGPPLVGWAQDLSAGGSMVLLEDAEAGAPGTEGRAARCLRLVEERLAGGFEVRFRGSNLAVTAQVVRVTVEAGGRGEFGVACRFERELTPAEVGAALEGVAGGSPRAPAPALPLVPRRAPPPYALVFDGGGQVEGPRFAGPMVAASSEEVEVEVPSVPADLAALATDSLVPPLTLRLLHAGRPLWDGPPTVRAAEAEAGSLRLRCSLPGGLPPALTRLLRRAR